MLCCKKLISFALAVVIIFSTFTCAFAYDSAYNSDIDNLQNVTATVQDQGGEESCLTYALATTAESYCIKNKVLPNKDFVFDGSKLKKKIGDSTNFGTVLYSAVNYNLGNECYITGIENLTGRGERYLKRKIKENGAIFVAIPLPEGGMKNADYYNDKTYSFNCKSADGTDADFSKGINHAVSIVGWDDGFSCENYNGKNRMNGAWICKNSYGSKWGKNGYFYLSYSYTDYFLYSAAVEVTRYPEIASVKSADKPHLSFRKAGAVGFRYGSEIKNAEVTVSVKGASAQTLKADVSNGYTFVPIASPVYNSGIKVSVNGSELADSAISIYYIKSGSPLASPSKPLQEDNWDEAVENLNIDVSETSFTADSLVNMNTVKHIVKLNSVDNRFTIIPEDGYVFTDDTKVYIERKVYGREDPEIISGKISELKDELDFTDGRLIVKSKYIGDAFARGMRIDLDESSKIKDVFLIKDNGSGSRLEPESYSIETSPETIPDSGSYYAKITLNGYYVTDDFKVIVSRDGKNNEYPPADIKVEGATVTAGVIIEIPDITQDIIQTLKTLLHIFAILLAPLGLNG